MNTHLIVMIPSILFISTFIRHCIVYTPSCKCQVRIGCTCASLLALCLKLAFWYKTSLVSTDLSKLHNHIYACILTEQLCFFRPLRFWCFAWGLIICNMPYYSLCAGNSPYPSYNDLIILTNQSTDNIHSGQGHLPRFDKSW